MKDKTLELPEDYWDNIPDVEVEWLTLDEIIDRYADILTEEQLNALKEVYEEAK